jgi:hypothetical protein
MLFRALAFASGGLERCVCQHFLAQGVTALALFAWGLFDASAVVLVVGSAPWLVGAPVTSILLAILFRRAGRGGAAAMTGAGRPNARCQVPRLALPASNNPVVSLRGREGRRRLPGVYPPLPGQQPAYRTMGSG